LTNDMSNINKRIDLPARDLARIAQLLAAASSELKASNDAAERVQAEREWNAGARIADDFSCPCCGRRGFRFVCPTCGG
jgi:hypothetical protein